LLKAEVAMPLRSSKVLFVLIAGADLFPDMLLGVCKLGLHVKKFD